MKLQLSALCAAVALLVIAGCESPQQAVPPDTLVAMKVSAAPNMAALASDPTWARAQPLSIKLSEGANFAGGKGETTATLKAVYTADMLYMLIQYAAIPLENGKPKFKDKSGRAANAGGKYWIAKGDEVAFDDSKFKPGDEVAGHISIPLLGDRADVRVATAWANGMYTYVISRKLVTGSKYDVQWNDLTKRYPFGIAAFDNAQVRHATSDGPSFLVFGK